jgi:hypothetical protein
VGNVAETENNVIEYTCENLGHDGHGYALIFWNETLNNLGRKLPTFLGNIDAFLSDYPELCRRVRQPVV